jgi:conjugative transfer pilus assembly protein TraH
METLQKKIQALNQGFANSPSARQGLINDVADALRHEAQGHTSLLGMVKGLGDVVRDPFLDQRVGPHRPGQDNVPAAEKTNVEGNLAWQALKRKGGGGLVRRREDTLLEAMMSLTGSVIVGTPEAAADGQGRTTASPICRGICLASDLLNGTREREDAAQLDNAWPHRCAFYQCGPAGGRSTAPRTVAGPRSPRALSTA